MALAQTTFRVWDGRVVTIANHLLYSKDLVNIRRAGPMMEATFIQGASSALVTSALVTSALVTSALVTSALVTSGVGCGVWGDGWSLCGMALTSQICET